MVEITRFNVLSVAKVAAAISLVIGLILGVIMLVIGSVGTMGAQIGMFPGLSGIQGGAATLGLLFVVIIMTIVYAIVGFIWGAIVAFLYNVAAGWFGGIEFETDTGSMEVFSDSDEVKGYE